MKTVLVTGANGFIGTKLCSFLKEQGYYIRGTVRKNLSTFSGIDEYIQIDDINDSTGCQKALAGVDTVIHLVARAHIINDSVTDPLEAFRKINVIGTKNLARMAAMEGIRRFIFISSIGVNGEFTNGKPFTEEDIPCPASPYAISKFEAELELSKIKKETKMEIVILRPPLVYGVNAPGNFSRLMNLIKTGIPLPLNGIKQLRSYINISNLVDAIAICITHPLAAGETFLISDCQDVSLTDLMRRIAYAMKKKIFLFYLPSGILKTLCRLAGKGKDLEKLTGALTIDCTKIQKLLGWKPIFTMENELDKIALWYHDKQKILKRKGSR